MVVIKLYVVVVYDISIDKNGQAVWRRVFKTCKKYLSHVQNSVFEGEVSESQLFELSRILDREIRDDLDSVIIFKSRHERWLDKDILGLKIDSTSSFL
jgi:CRISPR-associated protein Cas2